MHRWRLRHWLAQRCSAITEQVSEQTPLAFIRNRFSMCSSFLQSGLLRILRLCCLFPDLKVRRCSWLLKTIESRYSIILHRKVRGCISNYNQVNQTTLSIKVSQQHPTHAVRSICLNVFPLGRQDPIRAWLLPFRVEEQTVSFTSCRHVWERVL